MIYIGTKHLNIQEHHYFYNNNFIYAIVYDYYNNSNNPDILYYKQFYDLSNSILEGARIKLNRNEVPFFEIPDVIICCETRHDFFKNIEKIIFEKI